MNPIPAKRSHGTIITLVVITLLSTGCGGKEAKKPLADWQIRKFVQYSNIPTDNHLYRINFINMRNKFALDKYDSQRQKDKSASKVYREKTFESSVFMILKNADMVSHHGVYGKVTVKQGQWLLVWYMSDFTPDNYLAKDHLKKDSKGNFVRDYQDFDCSQEGGKIVFYKLFRADSVGFQNVVNRVYEPDKVLYWNLHVTVEPEVNQN